jgi:RimJ/RimL family protein N-acetyltransferase
MQGPPLDPVLRDVPTLVETARLELRPPQPGDGPEAYAAVAESLADLRRYPASMRWALAEQSVASAEKYCREAHAHFIARSDLPYFMFLRGTTTLVGATGLHRFDWSVPKFEIGYWVRSSYRGRGLVTEGVGALADMAITALGARRLEIHADNANVRSWQVCERLGFALEGIHRNETIDPSGVLRDTRVYARIA